ncbi:hypothetical protein J4407_03375 [Candidatus Pacearchaeota archaeon]|nr:hypothetical protein [Candidatus Pacearchaeota archaeon]
MTIESEVCDFFKSEKFKDVLEIIKSRRYISHDGLIHNIIYIKELSKENFLGACKCVFANLEEKVVSDKKHLKMSYIDYDSVRFYRLISEKLDIDYWTERRT